MLRTEDSRYYPAAGTADGGGHELILRAPPGQHPLALSLFRPYSAEWLIQPFQHPERVVGFFNTYRQLYPVTRYTLRDIADQFQRWVKERAAKRNIPIVDAPKGLGDEFVDSYFERAKPDAVVVILKAREPARIMTAIGDKVANRWHLQFAQRWIVQYNFYINDRNWGQILDEGGWDRSLGS
jgi:hypothetical protein